MKIQIVEDEQLAVKQMEQYLRDYDPRMEILPAITTVQALRKWLKDPPEVDLVFCDIELSDGNVLEVLAAQPLPAVVIFTTAYDHYWREALKLNGIEYLLKPLTREGVHGALQKIQAIRALFNRDGDLLTRLSDMIRSKTGTYKKRFPVRIGNDLLVIEADQVGMFRISEGVIFAYLEKGRRFPLEEQTLSELEEVLNPEFYFRINRSEIVNRRFLGRIRVETGGVLNIKLEGMEETLTVSVNRQNGFREWLRSS